MGESIGSSPVAAQARADVATAGEADSVAAASCSLALELTYSCNQTCAYCYNPSRSAASAAVATPRGPGEPPTALLLDRLRRVARAWRLGHVTLTGGEPLRHPGLFPVLGLLRELAIRPQIITNGTLVSDEVAQRLRSHQVSAVQVTLNGPTAALHREHVGRDSFDEARRGVRSLLRHGVPVTGCTVVTRRNAEHVGAIIDGWRALGVRRIALSRFSPAGVSLASMRAWLARRRDLIAAFRQAQVHAQDGLDVYCTVPVPACLMDTAEFAPVRFGQCAIGSTQQEFALGPDGRLRLCTLHGGHLAGGRDVLDESWDLGAIPRSTEVCGYRGRLPEFCQGCGAAPACLGGCGASQLYRDDGAPRALDPLVEQYFASSGEPSTHCDKNHPTRLELTHDR